MDDGKIVSFEPALSLPDMAVLDGGRLPPPALPLDMFNPFWKDWITSRAECVSVPIDYVAYPLLSCAASLVGNARRIKARGKWDEPCVIWSGIIGGPSSRKSPAVDIAKSPLSEVERDLSADYSEVVRQWETDREWAKAKKESWQAEVKTATKNETPPPLMPPTAVEPDKPARPRIIANDTTPEALTQLLSANRRGLLCVRDELSGFLSSFDRYKSGGGSDRALWIEAFGGRSYTIDRASKPEPVIIENLAVSITGGIQPDRVNTLLMTGDDDGLSSRFLLTMPHTIRPTAPTGEVDNEPVLRAFRRLLSLDLATDEEGRKTPIVLSITDAAADILYRWQGAAYDQDSDAVGLYGSHVGKFGSYVLRLALVSSLMNWAAGDDESPSEISADAVGHACDFIEEYARPMARRVYGEASLSPAERAASYIARRIRKEKIQTVNARVIRREWRVPGLKTSEDVREAISVLEDAYWLFEAGSRAGDTPGRQSSDYTVNPRVHSDG
ncbi:DUF3987 domain-containing protein [Pelagibius litoralis]|uniref:DUF3987 domain-containing protein n=1 Tax=Pelagibius litoralis TaxID=374515 RepID=A0A967C3Z3_9PROT|nr:YfjI family protein [Pelagibius litoralis]NIA67905.1 DUF3987 domain-containing protein [Pelagibius litoralis]